MSAGIKNYSTVLRHSKAVSQDSHFPILCQDNMNGLHASEGKIPPGHKKKMVDNMATKSDDSFTGWIICKNQKTILCSVMKWLQKGMQLNKQIRSETDDGLRVLL